MFVSIRTIPPMKNAMLSILKAKVTLFQLATNPITIIDLITSRGTSPKKVNAAKHFLRLA